MDTLKHNPTRSEARKYCSGCDMGKPAIKGAYFGANRSTGDGLARRCLECSRAADRRRQPKHQAQKQIRQKRQKKEARKREIDGSVTGNGKPRRGSATPHTTEIIEDFWKAYDQERFVDLLVEHLENCETSNNIGAVWKTIEWVMKLTAEHGPPSLGDLSHMTQNELACELQKILQSCAAGDAAQLGITG